MSLLEDVFLQDEANEAQELERIIEGDEFEGRPRSDSDDNSEKEDEAEEDKRRVDPNTTKTRRVIKNPRFILNPARLTGPRGIQVIPDHFKDFKFKGKGHEKEDLDLVLKKLEHWAYRLYPKFQFEDCLKKIETLGKKRPVMVHLHKIRSDQFLTEETVVQKDSSDEEAPPEDEFDKLLQQQIELARSTPAPGSVKKVLHSPVKENRSLIMPKATSSPSISEEQRERMLRNRKLAEERRLARLKNQTNINNSQNVNINEQEASNINDKENIDTETVKVVTEETIVRHNRLNVIDSSDEEMTTVNESISVDVHNVLECGKNLDKSNHNIEESVTINSKNDVTSNGENEDIDHGNINTEAIEVDSEGVIIKHNRSNIISSSDEDEEILANESLKVDVHNVIENSDKRNEINENAEKNLTNTSKDDIICDNAKESNEDIEKISNNSSKDDNNLLESEINNKVIESVVTDSVEKIVMDEKKVGVEEDKNNQEMDKNQNDYVDDLMDVDFSEDF